jgi:AcrR family transcriptional regulator
MFPDQAPKRRRDKDATKQALLDAGIQVFAEQGYDAATTRAVALAAGVNEQLITRYFGGKAGLLVSILRSFGEAERRGAKALPPVCPEVATEIESFLRFHLDHSWETRDFTKVVLSRAMVDADVACGMRRHFAESRVPLLVERLKTFRTQGRLRCDLDIEGVAQALSSLSFGLAVVDQVVFGVTRDVLCRTVSAMTEVIARGLMAQKD